MDGFGLCDCIWKGILFEYATVVIQVNHQHRGPESDRCLDRGGNFSCKSLCFVRRIENRVATLNVSFDVLAAEIQENVTKILHRQAMLATDIDTAQQRDTGRHVCNWPR